MLLKYEKLLTEYTPYIVTTKDNLEKFNQKPFGLELKFIDAAAIENTQFLDVLNKIDGLSYGDKGLPMEKWVAFDAGILPSGFVGFGKIAKHINNSLKSKLNISDEDFFVPLSEACAIPNVKNGTWISHTLGSLDSNNGLGTLTKALAIEVYGAKEMMGVAQYDNKSLKVHSKFGDMEILSALSPAHSLPDMTFVYKLSIKEDTVKKALEKSSASEKSVPDFYLNPFDLAAKKAMHKDITTGNCNYFILWPGLVECENDYSVPIKRMPYKI
jgi:hypothetical protein